MLVQDLPLVEVVSAKRSIWVTSLTASLVEAWEVVWAAAQVVVELVLVDPWWETICDSTWKLTSRQQSLEARKRSAFATWKPVILAKEVE